MLTLYYIVFCVLLDYATHNIGKAGEPLTRPLIVNHLVGDFSLDDDVLGDVPTNKELLLGKYEI